MSTIVERLAPHFVAAMIKAARAGDVEAAHWLISYAADVVKIGLKHPLNVGRGEDEALCVIPREIAEYLGKTLNDVVSGKPVDASFGLRRGKGHKVNENAYRDRDTLIWRRMRERVNSGKTLDEAAEEVSAWLKDEFQYDLSDSQVRKIYLKGKKYMKEVHQID